MANLALFALALVAIVAFAEVSAYRTTVITTTIEDNGFPPYVDGLPTRDQDNPRGSQERCRRHIQGQQLNHCHMQLTQGTFFDSKLRMAVENPTEKDQHLQQCCDELKQVNERCQCEAIQKVVQQAQMQQQQGSQQQVFRKAQMLNAT